MSRNTRPDGRRQPLWLLLSTTLLSTFSVSAAFAEDAGARAGAAAPASTGAADAPESAGTTVSEFQVTAKALSGVGSLDQARLVQKQAPNIVIVEPQSEIKKIPDFVVGDVVRRLPGASVINKSGEGRSIQVRGLDPNLNGVTYDGVLLPAGSINGGGRAVPLDAIPAPLVGGLELFKTNAPEQEATALGGQLNILPRDLEPGQDPYLEVIAAAGFRDPHPTSLAQGAIDGGFRFGFDNSPGARKPFTVAFFATDLNDTLKMDDIQQTFASASNNALKSAQRVEYDQTKVRKGYGGKITWDVDDNNKLYFTAFQSAVDYHPVKYQSVYNFSNPSFVSGGSGPFNAKASFQEAYNDNLIYDRESLYKFGGVSNFGALKVDYYGAYASNQLYSPYSYTATFNNPTSATVRVDNVSSPLLPAMTTSANVLNYAAYNLSSLSNASQNDRDDQWSGHLGLSAPLNFGAVKGVLSGGAGVRLENVVHDDLKFTYSGLPTTLTGEQMAGNQTYTIFDGAYGLGTPVSAGAMRQLFNGRTYPTIVENVASDRITDQQGALNDRENVYSGYVQYAASWNKLGVLAGVRYEATSGQYSGTQTSTSNGVTTLTPRTVSQDYGNFFPTVQLRYAFTDNLIARANWSTAIGRPGFNQVTATQTINFSTGAITQGNPNLKPITGSNYDLSLEYYLPHGGIVSAGVFDKEFSNYIVATTLYGTYPGIAGSATFTTFANIDHASARGIELNYRQQMTFLPGLLSGFGVAGNFTYVDTRGSSRAGVVETLPNTTPHVYNGEAFYDWGRLHLQLDANYLGLTMTSLGSTPNQDNYVQPYLNFDVGARYALTKHITLFFQGRNVTNTMQNATSGPSANRFTELQYFGSSYLFGVDLKL